ncbi:Hypothetical protein FKW44_016007 [Caligus rogercresseyi]|uniref:Uncharacterized protein n=1 Tax=Caligus rogercresseyi TaxID=217165 RepID=A0A7T8K052_CALRO|nr:Hypothetical protein FKW44_016007 [Caligus rogercresseyi]
MRGFGSYRRRPQPLRGKVLWQRARPKKASFTLTYPKTPRVVDRLGKANSRVKDNYIHVKNNY